MTMSHELIDLKFKKSYMPSINIVDKEHDVKLRSAENDLSKPHAHHLTFMPMLVTIVR